MKPRALDPRRLDVAAFARAGGALGGESSLDQLGRLAASVLAPVDGDPPEPVRWHAQGEQRPVAGGAPEVWLHLRATTSVRLECQRCLQPVRLPLEVDRRFLFVRDEDEAARQDEEREEDVLVLTRALDLIELVEDELLLALPIVPRHETCPQPLPVAASEPEATTAEAPSPFAALAALKRGGS